MKKIILVSIFSTLFIAGCYSPKIKTTYFKEQKSGKIYNRNELNKIKIQLVKKLKPMLHSVQVREVIIDSTVSHDSIIKTFTISISTLNKKAEPPKEKIYSYLNKRLPPVVLYSLNNKKIDFSKLNGKPTLLNFWFTTCIPCIGEMPVLNQLKDKYKGKVNFISVAYENRKSVEAFLKTHKFNFEQVAGASEFVNKLEIHHFPKNIFIDKNGIVRRIEGGVSYIKKDGKMEIGSGKEFEKYIKEIL